MEVIVDHFSTEVLQIKASCPCMAAWLCVRGANNSNVKSGLLCLCHIIVSTSPHFSPASTLQRLHTHAHGPVFVLRRGLSACPLLWGLIKWHVAGTNPDDALLHKLHYISERIFIPETAMNQLKRTTTGISFGFSLNDHYVHIRLCR